MIQASIQPAEAGAAMCDYMAMILRLKAVKFDLTCTRQFSIPELSACCDRLDALLPGTELRYQSIQHELIQNPDFAPWLALFKSKAEGAVEKETSEPCLTWPGLETRLSGLLEECQANQRSITACTQADVLAVLKQERLTNHMKLVWLENFAPMDLSSEDGMRTAENLRTCVDVPIALDEAQNRC